MKTEDLLVYGNSYIHKDLTKILLADLLNLNPLELLNYLDKEVSPEIVETFQKEVKYIHEGKPIQYAMGKVNFYGLDFIVNENVLIPRFETEELVETVVKEAKKLFTNPVDLIDLGCGTGAIGITLEKKLSTNLVDLIDISEKTLEVTKENIKKHKSKAKVIVSDMFENIDKKYDIIVSNPPYIKEEEEIEEIVKNNEPKIALYGGKDGLDCYRKILSSIESHMKDTCLVAFEIGSDQKEQIIELINNNIQNIEIYTKKDLSERDRIIYFIRKAREN